MTEYVELAPNGLFSYKWDGKKKKTIRRKAKKLSVGALLRCSCKIAEGTTLQDIFNTVDSYKLLKIIISQYSWCRDIDAFHAQAKEIHEDYEEEDKIDYLEIYHHVETNQSDEKIKHPGGLRERIRTVDFECCPCFHGIGPAPEKDVDEYGNPNPANRGNKTQQYSVSYSPMWKLANLPVKINENFDVYSKWVPGTKYKSEKIMSSSRDFSLLEVLDAIYWDISFMGGPEENAAFMEDMDEKISEIKSGEIAGIPWEQVSKRLGIPQKEEEKILGETDDKKPLKVILHPDVARFLGVNPDEIPLDDKEIMRPDEKDE